MGWVSLTAIFLSVILNSIAMVMLKMGARQLGVMSFTEAWIENAFRMASQPFIVGGVVLYAISLFVWIVVISREAVSVAYPVTAFCYVLNALAAGYFFEEVLRPSQWGGILFILIGVALIAKP